MVTYKGKKMTAKEALDLIQHKPQFVLKRKKDSGISTIGELYVNGVLECYTLEDTFRAEKIKHETRIPSGLYEIKLRTFGGHHERYKKHSYNPIAEAHKGMLWLQDVPKFTDILIHIGNRNRDTSGCILVGKSFSKDMVSQSTLAYYDLYIKAIKILEKDRLYISIEDEFGGLQSNAST